MFFMTWKTELEVAVDVGRACDYYPKLISSLVLLSKLFEDSMANDENNEDGRSKHFLTWNYDIQFHCFKICRNWAFFKGKCKNVFFLLWKYFNKNGKERMAPIRNPHQLVTWGFMETIDGCNLTSKLKGAGLKNVRR